MYEIITSPFKIGGLELKNRIIFAPTTLGLSQEETFAKLEAIAAGGCAMLIIGDVPVTGRTVGRTLYSRKGKAYYRTLVEIAHRHDCRICAQLHQSDTDIKAIIGKIPGFLTKKITPDELRMYVNAQVGPYISSLPSQKVRAITASFGEAAKAASMLGFDMVQIHGDRMCGSFSSSMYNSREDNYGGTPEKRARFAQECVTAVRRMMPEISIDFKLAVRQEDPHYGNAGVLVDELPVFVPLLEQAGVNSFHVTLANHSDLQDTIPPANHPYLGSEGCFLDYCDKVRGLTGLPVCGVGGLVHPDFIEEQLRMGRIDCAAMSRQLIADPQWMAKVLGGKEKEIHFCVRCNRKCLGGMQEHKGVHCIYDREDKKQERE